MKTSLKCQPIQPIETKKKVKLGENICRNRPQVRILVKQFEGQISP